MTLSRSLAIWLVGFLVLFGVRSEVHAQSIGAVQIETAGWAYIPIFEGSAVQAIVALRKDGSSAAISALWCEVEENGAWSAMAWKNSSPEEIAAFVFSTCNAQVDDGSLENMVLMWPIELEHGNLLAALDMPLQPVPFGDGVPLGDPLENLIQVNPGVLAPLELIGYPAVSSMSGSPVSGGTFTPYPIDPVLVDCLRASELLSVLALAFESSMNDIDVVGSIFLAESNAINQSCGCSSNAFVTLSDTGWSDNCGSWVQTAGPTGSGTDCYYQWQRTVVGVRTRVRRNTCTGATCTQTRYRDGIQSANSLGVTSPGVPCAPSGPQPTAACMCSGYFTCQTGPWVPAQCP